MVFAGPIFWDAVHAKQVMCAYRDFIATAPEELGIFVGLKTVPSMDPFPKEGWGKRACAIIGAYNGSAADGQRLLAPLLGSLPAPIFNWMGDMPFPSINALFDPFFPKGLQWYWKGDFVQTLPDEAIEKHIAEAAKAPTELCLMHLYPIDGAVRRVPRDATPWVARDASFSMVIAGISPNPQDAEKLKAWGRAYWKAVHPYNMGGGYVNFMFDDEADGRLKASYGDNYARLATAKTKYDPKNLFRVNQNIAPAATSQSREERAGSEDRCTMFGVGRMLMIVGGALLLLGVLFSFGPRVPWLGRLPGDIVIERDNVRFYFPITTSIVISIVISLLAAAFRR